jgi:glutamyl-tRNA synthetase
LALLGWNAGTEQELFSKEELIEKFSIDRVHSGGAKFDYEKAKWFNQEWLKKLPITNYQLLVKELFTSKGIAIGDDAYFAKVMELIKDRCTLIPDFYEQGNFFFTTPATLDVDAVKPKWNEEKKLFFSEFVSVLLKIPNRSAGQAGWELGVIEEAFKNLATAKNIKPGELQLPLRVMLVGGKFGPPVFVIAAMIGKDETVKRIENALAIFNSLT